MKKLFLIPAPLSETDFQKVFPEYNLQIISELQVFVVENIRTARRFIKKAAPTTEIDRLQFFELSEHLENVDLQEITKVVKSGIDIGFMSEAGCPAVADPGAVLVRLVQKFDYQIIPLVGASSILLSLMASGFNGQNFAFVGYLPVKEQDRLRAIKKLENRVFVESQTQIFIETPYRNTKLISDLLKVLNLQTHLCIAADLTAETQFITTKTVAEWKKSNLPDLNKRPCIFLIYK
ncbi:MAG: SAM-dependent methyltransferase [Prevotellaceae bacterium]|jgi:16S rRNA (cytidine1402-2'-O)-methyltransferase|nr:SAM-dependent methyltransferase [Prevotellaceae bacterium]